MVRPWLMRLLAPQVEGELVERIRYLRIMAGPAGYPRLVIRCRLTQQTRIQMRGDDEQGNGLGRYARNVIRCRLIQEPRVQMRVDDVAGNVWVAVH